MESRVAVLETEGFRSNVSEEDLFTREYLANAFRTLPKEVFSRLRFLQPQSGCLNRCSFCSQKAKPIIYHLDNKGLKNLFAALKTVALEVMSEPVKGTYSQQSELLNEDGIFSSAFKMPKTGLLGYERTNHRPGVIFVYLDNDIFSYPFLKQFLQHAENDLGIKIRISTVGFSRHNEYLQKMHDDINKNLVKSIAGFRLSFTPYTFGWTKYGETLGHTSRNEYLQDLSNVLRTYQPVVENLGSGNRNACIELRFRPFIQQNRDFHETIIFERHVLHVGPYLLISRNKHREFNKSRVLASWEHSVKIDTPPRAYIQILSHEYVNNGDWEWHAKKIISAGEDSLDFLSSDKFIKRNSDLYFFSNDEISYFAIDPTIRENGVFAKQFFNAGKNIGSYIDSERYFLNTLLGYKSQKGFRRKSSWHNATWHDVFQVVNNLASVAARYSTINPDISNYINNEVFPIIQSLCMVLENSGYPANFFFDPQFVIDTGTICNLGYGYSEFKGIVPRNNIPITPQQERAFGEHSSLGLEGMVWRIAVGQNINNQIDQAPTIRIGNRDSRYAIFVEELDLRKTSSIDGPVQRRWILPYDGIVEVKSEKLDTEYLIPGQLPIIRKI